MTARASAQPRANPQHKGAERGSLGADDAIRSVVADVELTADFSADGTISGSTGCNSFRGGYTLEGRKLNVGPLAATKTACPTTEASEQEAGYLSALESAVLIDQVGSGLTLLNAKLRDAAVARANVNCGTSRRVRRTSTAAG